MQTDQWNIISEVKKIHVLEKTLKLLQLLKLLYIHFYILIIIQIENEKKQYHL